MRKDLHFPAGVISSLHALQLAGALPGVAAALCRGLFMGAAAPKFKDADRVPDSSTVRRWSQGVDEFKPIDSFVRKTAARAAQWLESAPGSQNEAAFLSWLTPVLEVLCPMRR
jgi:hypothetical protein